MLEYCKELVDNPYFNELADCFIEDGDYQYQVDYTRVIPLRYSDYSESSTDSELWRRFDNYCSSNGNFPFSFIYVLR